MMPKRQILKFSLVLSLVLSLSYVPTAQTQRAHAILGVGDINLESVPTVVRFILEAIAFPIAQTMIDDMTKATIDWANTGFEGSPAYNINPEAYFTNLVDESVGEVIQNELPFLCSPFRDKIQFTLSLNYYQPAEKYFQCTFTEAYGNIEDFAQGFRDGGGWDSWFELTQNPTNNPYGAYIAAKARIDSKIGEKSTRSRDELNQSSGYLNYRKCVAYNPDESTLNQIRNDLKSNKQRAPDRYQTPYDLSKQAGECIERGDIISPGTSIKGALETTFAAPVAKLINADSVDQLLSAFSTGLLRRFVFARGDYGLFSSDSIGAERELLDIDGDGIPDGYDTDPPTDPGYGELDICSHGIVDPEESPSNENCRPSKTVTSSPFFLPICEKLDITIAELDRHVKFVSENKFDKNLSNVWINKTLPATSAVGDFLSLLSRMELLKYTNAMGTLGKYSKDLDTITKSLTKDGDLKEGWFSGGDNKARLQHAANTQKIITYLNSFQSELVKNCSNPDEEALSEIPAPDIESLPDPNAPTTNNEGQAQVSATCFATSEGVTLGESVTWIAQTSLQSPSYSWNGDSLSGRTGPTASITYSSVGPKNAGVSVSGIDATGSNQSLSVSCVNGVTVTNEENF